MYMSNKFNMTYEQTRGQRMTLIQDMSEPERQSWITLMADIFVFSIFVKSMTSGRFANGLSVDTQDPSGLVGVYIWIIVATIIIHGIIASIFALRGKADGLERDERDIEIERKGARNGFWVVSIAINIIIFQLLIENTIPSGYEPLFSVQSPSHMFFALMATMFIGDIVYRATMVLAYRKQ